MLLLLLVCYISLINNNNNCEWCGKTGRIEKYTTVTLSYSGVTKFPNTSSVPCVKKTTVFFFSRVLRE